MWILLVKEKLVHSFCKDSPDEGKKTGQADSCAILHTASNTFDPPAQYSMLDYIIWKVSFNLIIIKAPKNNNKKPHKLNCLDGEKLYFAYSRKAALESLSAVQV